MPFKKGDKVIFEGNVTTIESNQLLSDFVSIVDFWDGSPRCVRASSLKVVSAESIMDNVSCVPDPSEMKVTCSHCGKVLEYSMIMGHDVLTIGVDRCGCIDKNLKEEIERLHDEIQYHLGHGQLEEIKKGRKK